MESPGRKRPSSRSSSTNKVHPGDNENPLQVQEVNDEDEQTINSQKSISVAVISDGGKPEMTSEVVDDEELERKNEARRNRPPLAFCKFIVNFPKSAFALTLGIHMMFIFVTGALMFRGYDIIPFSLDQLPLDLKNDVDHKREGAWLYRNMEVNNIYNRLDSSTDTVVERERSVAAQVVELYYEMKDGNVFTKSALEAIRQVEEQLTNVNNFSAYCFLNRAGNCTKPTSILRYFDGSFAALDPALNDTDFNDISGTLSAAILNNKTKSALRYHLGANYSFDETSKVLSSPITRSRLMLAFPLAGYNGTEDREDEQRNKVQGFLNSTLRAKLEELERKDIGGVDFFYMNGHLIGLSISATAMSDLLLVVAGMAFIFIFMWVQTSSLWITGWSIMSIFTSFLAANMLYRIVLDYAYFGTFNILAIFIILGIGADDVFVFVDTFKSTGHHEYPSLAHRLSDCYRKASVAMLFTSVTTATAFFISAGSPLLAVSTFGLFAGLLVVVNYLTVLTFIPTVVIIWHNTWSKCQWCPCLCKPKEKNPNGPDAQDDHHRKNPIVRFFRGPYYRFVTHKIARWVILVVFVSMAGVFIYFASQLAPNEDQIEFLKPDTNFGKALNRGTSGFTSNSEQRNVEVIIAWGLKEHDFSSCHKTNFTCQGKTQWDDTFDLNSAEAQNALNDFCRTLKTLSAKEEEDLKVQRNFVTNDLEVKCFIHDLEDYFELEESKTTPPSNARKYPTDTNFTLPHVKANMDRLFTYNPVLYNVSSLPSNFKRYFETSLSYWMYDGMNPATSGVALRNHGAFLGEQEESGQTQSYKVGGFKFGNRLRYAAFVVNTTLNGRALGYPTGLPVRNNWEEYVSTKMKQMPVPLQGGFQLTTGTWEWLKTQETLSTSAVLGIVIGVSVAFPILVAATNNLITGTLAFLMLVFITVNVVGFLPMLGWKLGILESLNMVLVVGLSVDYVMHLAEGYSRSSHVTRLGRTQDMLEEVGISVLSGAVTTSGAALCMLLAQILFFTQFGLVMFITIFHSIMHGLVLFPVVMALVGPEGDTGRVTTLFKKCCHSKSQ